MVRQPMITDPRLKEARDKFREGLRKTDRQDGVRMAQLLREYLNAIEVNSITLKKEQSL